MEKIIDFNGIKIAVTWDERLKPGTVLYVHTENPGLAMNVIELFLDEAGKQNLWYESGWLSYADYQEMILCESEEENWQGWTRECVLSKSNAKKLP